jgi:MFS family permease
MSKAAPDNRLSPIQFVLAFGVVSMLGDFVYEGARSVVGPYLATLGASAALVGLVTGLGEAVALVLRLATGPLADRTRRYWPITILGYAITMISVPLLAVVTGLWPAAGLIIAERFGKAVRTPARDTMLAQASAKLGRGMAFAIHEAMDQSGAFIGPLVVAGMLAIAGYRAGFAVLAIPGALALVTLFLLQKTVPRPADYEAAEVERPDAPISSDGRLPREFWIYGGFTALAMAGFATFPVLAFHQEVRHVIAAPMIPVTYAAAMAAAALSSLASGWAYDRVGLHGVVVVLPLAVLAPALAFTELPSLVWAGVIIWGLAMGIHESTMRAAVADLVPATRRGTGYGLFTAIYGLAWLVGATVVGMLYEVSYWALMSYVVVTQALALLAFLPLRRIERQR